MIGYNGNLSKIKNVALNEIGHVMKKKPRRSYSGVVENNDLFFLCFLWVTLILQSNH